MSRFDKIRTPCSVFKPTTLLLFLNNYTAASASSINPRFYGPRKMGRPRKGHAPRRVGSGPQSALFEYLHLTRGLPSSHAEHMSKNCPQFLRKMLANVQHCLPEKQTATEAGSGAKKHSVARFLRYHPINEFEPFFESIGLKPSRFAPFLPPHLIYLTDDAFLLQNYGVLCDFGISPRNIGKIYAEAALVFRYGSGVLQSHLQALTQHRLLQLDHSSLVKLVACSPSVLTGDARGVFFKVLEEVKILGVECAWIVDNMSQGEDVYNWSRMLGLLCFLKTIGCSNQQLRGFISQHPGLLLEGSGNTAFGLFGFLLKFGFRMDGIASLLPHLLQVPVGQALMNLRGCCNLLLDIQMETQEIRKIIQSHAALIGSCSLKKTKSLLSGLNTGRKRLREVIRQDPTVLKNWVYGSRIEQVPKSEEGLRKMKRRISFLVGLGIIEGSVDMKRALRHCRGNSAELQERLDCFVKAGLDRKDVAKMVKRAPQILNQSKDVIERKIEFLINDMAYPVRSLLAFPTYIFLTIDTVKHKVSMYNWLVGQGVAERNLALKTFLATSNEYFISHYVRRHPEGLEVWEKLRKQIYSD